MPRYSRSRPFKKFRKRTFGFRKRKFTKRSAYSNNRIYSYRQTVAGDQISIGFNGNRTLVQTGTVQTSQIVCRLADLSQAASFTTLYDQYKITKVSIKFMPMVTGQSIIAQTYTVLAGSGSGGQANNPGLLITCIDQDGTPPTTLSAFEQYATAKNQPVISTRPHVRWCAPKVVTGVQDSNGNIVSAGVGRSMWCDCANASINHFFGAWYLDPYGAAGAASAQTFNIMATYWVKFRNVR